jgi:hypothetical protein
MANSKCPQCGLVNPLSASTCKRCGTELTAQSSTDETAAAPTTENEAEADKEKDKEKDNEPLGAWGCIQVIILLVIAGSITGYLGIYIREYLPSGTYPVIVLIAIFIPAAVVGLIVGGIVLYLINIPVKLFRKKSPDDKA